MEVDLNQITATTWDALVIGTGMGGATLGYELARAGQRVLFCEKGIGTLEGDGALKGSYAEMLARGRPEQAAADIYRRAGRWWEPIEEHMGAGRRQFIPFLGSATGGSSAIYGMVMQRFFPEDFRPGPSFPGATEANLVDAWPISYDDLAPHYQRAEQLFGVRGELSPLRKGRLDPIPDRARPAVSRVATEIRAFLESRHIHPYRPPLAFNDDNCLGCQGYLCARTCRIDSATVFLEPAIRNFGAALITRTQAVELEADRKAVRQVICERDGKRIALKGRIVVLAAGALASPVLLLRSKSADWPQGVANSSGLVGRNLMRRFFDIYLLSVKGPNDDTGIKDIYFDDFYTQEQGKLGIVQSFGHLFPAEMAASSLVDDVRDGPMPWLSPVVRSAVPVLTWYMRRKFSRSYAMVSTMEDMPYSENKVFPTSGDAAIGFQYRLHDHESARIRIMRQKLKDLLRPYSPMVIKQAENNKTFIALASGTCRFGNDPQTSVLNRFNQAHDLSNLYVVDSSFFPSGSAMNSALTICANALRVAQHLT